MAPERAPSQHRHCLPPGTVVAQWRVLGCHGHGSYGVVHRAVRIGHESEGPVALKRALYPWDPRFMREVGLLSLVHHPSIPRLLGHGFWKHPSGTVYPFIIMDWIDGTPLYDWARQHNPSSRQVLRLLAQLARALQATHEARAVHRDVKGENVLVRHSDGRAMLADFGSGNYYAAARMTWQPVPPGTPAYQSPEAGLFSIRAVRSPDSRYVATPADDVFALGTTAYRLVTGDYPPSPEPQMDEKDSWYMAPAPIRPPHELNPKVEPQLSALILRMLSLSPQDRGTAAELAQALEAAAELADRTADQPLFDPLRTPPQRASAQAQIPAWLPWRTLALVGSALALLSWWAGHELPAGAPAKHPASSSTGSPGSGTTDLADTARALPSSAPVTSEPISQELPPEPFDGQLRPNERGQCPGQEQVALNGGCWVEHSSASTEKCEQNGYFTLKGKCYAPAMNRRRKPQPTSSPLDWR